VGNLEEQLIKDIDRRVGARQRSNELMRRRLIEDFKAAAGAREGPAPTAERR
jgi:hypothetical protein